MTEHEYAHKQAAWELDATASALAANLGQVEHKCSFHNCPGLPREFYLAQEQAESLQAYARAMQAEAAKPCACGGGAAGAPVGKPRVRRRCSIALRRVQDCGQSACDGCKYLKPVPPEATHA